MTVITILRDVHHLAPANAAESAAIYRRKLEDVDADLLVLNHPVEGTAEAVLQVMREDPSTAGLVGDATFA